MAPIPAVRRTRTVAVLQFQRERCFRFRFAEFHYTCTERIFRPAVARVASTVSRNDRNNVRDSGAGRAKLGISRVAKWRRAVDCRVTARLRADDALFFGDVIPQRAPRSLARRLRRMRNSTLRKFNS